MCVFSYWLFVVVVVVVLITKFNKIYINKINNKYIKLNKQQNWFVYEKKKIVFNNSGDIDL